MTEPNLKDLEEVWASTTGGTVWVYKKDPLRPGNWVQKFIGGPGNAKMKLTIEEREYNEELVAWGNEHLNPFRNGLLIRILPKQVERGQFELTDDELRALVAGGTDDEFNEMIEKTTSEVILRRMLALAAPVATVRRFEALIALIKGRYPQGRGSAFVDDLKDKQGPLRALARL